MNSRIGSARRSPATATAATSTITTAQAAPRGDTAPSGQRDRSARELREVEGLEKRGGLAITRGQRGEIPTPLDQLEHGRVVVLPVGDHAAARVGRDDQGGHTRAEPEAVHGGGP